MPGDLAGPKVADDDPLRMAVDDHEIEHLAEREKLHPPSPDHPRKRGIGPEQELLAGLAARIEGSRHLGSAKGAVGEKPAYSRAKGTPCATHWSMMLTETSASLWVLASRER